jgi:hypothetical protein
MKLNVHAFALVRLKCAGIEAESHEAGVRKALERFDDLNRVFETANIRALPDGIVEVEFAEECTHFLVDDAGVENHDGSTWHDAKGDFEPFIVEQPLTAKQFRRHIGADGRVRLAIPVSLDELYNCRGIDAFNDLVDARLYGEGVHGCLTDLMYRPLRVLETEQVLIDIIARTEELVLDGVAPCRCVVCGDGVAMEDLRTHLIQHNPNAQVFDWEDVAAQFDMEA